MNGQHKGNIVSESTGTDYRTIGEAAIASARAVNSSRERALAETRQVVRLCANAIRAIHRSEFETRAVAAQAQQILEALTAELENAAEDLLVRLCAGCTEGVR
jgi:predicted translin family RNA/ssDNA-binding protein